MPAAAPLPLPVGILRSVSLRTRLAVKDVLDSVGDDQPSDAASPNPTGTEVDRSKQ
jgi:hypothetical protein